MSTILDQIIEKKRGEVALRYRIRPLELVRALADTAKKPGIRG